MAKIFAPPAEIKEPSFSEAMVDGHYDGQKHQAMEKKYVADLAAFLKKSGYNEPQTGEVIYFPVADGRAAYMVLKLTRGVQLIHLPLGDAWQFQMAHRLTKADVIQQIQQQKALAALFSRK